MRTFPIKEVQDKLDNEGILLHVRGMCGIFWGLFVFEGMFLRCKEKDTCAVHAVRAHSTWADNIFVPLVLFSASRHHPPLPPGEPVCRGCGIGRQARLRWLS